jgi:hypothetical protein
MILLIQMATLKVIYENCFVFMFWRKSEEISGRKRFLIVNNDATLNDSSKRQQQKKRVDNFFGLFSVVKIYDHFGVEPSGVERNLWHNQWEQGNVLMPIEVFLSLIVAFSFDFHLSMPTPEPNFTFLLALLLSLAFIDKSAKRLVKFLWLSSFSFLSFCLRNSFYQWNFTIYNRQKVKNDPRTKELLVI